MIWEDLNKLSKQEVYNLILTLLSRIKELEEQLNTNSTNSSMPPTRDKWKRPQSNRKKSDKKPGGQHGHKGKGLKIDREPDEVVSLKPNVCEKCGLDESDMEGTVSESR